MCRWPKRPGGALAAGDAVRPVPVGAGGGYRGARIAAARFVDERRLRRSGANSSGAARRTRGPASLTSRLRPRASWQSSRAARRGRAARPDVVLVLVLVLLLVSAIPAATHERIALGGPMRFATHDIAFVGWFVGAQADVWLGEPFGYLSEDAEVWAIIRRLGAGVSR